MKDDQLNEIIYELRRRPPACEVRLGIDFAHGVSGTARAAAEQSRVRLDHISRGDRTVDVYRGGRIEDQLIATREQVLQLLGAGAHPAQVDVEEAEIEANSNETAGSR